MSNIFITTHDGVEIKHGQRFFSLNVRPLPIKGYTIPANSIVGPYINPMANKPTGDILYFSTREAAEQYAKEHPYEG